MNTEYDKKIAELKEKIKELRQEKEKEQKLAAKAAWEAKPPEEKAEKAWKEVCELGYKISYFGGDPFCHLSSEELEEQERELEKMWMQLKKTAREAVRYEQNDRKRGEVK
jgi:hypothetical protein